MVEDKLILKPYTFAIPYRLLPKSKIAKEYGFTNANEKTTKAQQCIKIIAEIVVNSRVVARFNFRVT